MMFVTILELQRVMTTLLFLTVLKLLRSDANLNIFHGFKHGLGFKKDNKFFFHGLKYDQNYKEWRQPYCVLWSQNYKSINNLIIWSRNYNEWQQAPHGSRITKNNDNLICFHSLKRGPKTTKNYNYLVDFHDLKHGLTTTLTTSFFLMFDIDLYEWYRVHVFILFNFFFLPSWIKFYL